MPKIPPCPATPSPGMPGAREPIRQAWEWLQLIHSAGASAQDLRALERWVRSTPENQAAYNAARQRWKQMRPAADALLQADPVLRGARLRARHMEAAQPSSRRAWLGAAVGAAGVAGLAVAFPPLGLWPAPAEWGSDDRTAIGEQRDLVLQNRARVTLNTRTAVRRQQGEGADAAAGIQLLAGEAAIDMGVDGLPFTVVAGAGHCTARQGRFEVRYLDGQARVTCVEGALEVRHPAGRRSLRPGEQLVYDDKALSGTGPVDIAAVSAWRRGLLVFKQARLSEVLHEIGRYRSGRIVLMGTAAGDKRVTGQFAIGSLDLALVQLQHAFGLVAQALPGGVLILR